MNKFKLAIKLLPDRLGLRNAWQFWGWGRNREEYAAAMNAAGFSILGDGFIVAAPLDYWIIGAA